jgi:acetyl esterase/lipase
MLNTATIILCVGISVGISALAADPQAPPTAIPRVDRDRAYAEPKNERQTLDVYAPAAGKQRPVIFWIHGGGWQKGDKSEVHSKAQAFVDKGFVFASTNYRFVPNATMQQMTADVAKSIRWVYDHAMEYGGDPNSIFVMGWSAGAQLAALVSTDDRYLKAEGLSLSNIKGCVPVDADTFYPALQIDTVEARLDGRRPSGYRTKFPEGSDKELSSVLYVAKDKGIPPFLILHIDGRPESGTAIQAQVLANALRVAGVPVQVVPAEGKTHNTLNEDLGRPDDKPTKAVFEFVDGILRKSGQSHE